MKELEKVIKAVADGLRAMADGMYTISSQVDNYIKGQDDGARSSEAARRQPERIEKLTAKAEPRRDKKAPMLPPAEAILKLIQKSAHPVSNTSISQQTGFDARQVSNAIYRLKKQGKIKVIERGTYSVA